MIRQFLRKLAGMIVTYQANRIYNKAVVYADKRHAEERTRIYVVEDPLHPRRLATFDRKQFRKVKEILKKRSPRFSVLLMKDGAFYYTADAAGKSGLSDKEKEIRRLAFVRMNLKRARLL